MPDKVMICVQAPLVRYSSVHELVRMCSVVLGAYTSQVDAVLLDIWNEQPIAKKWSEYDRLMLGIFSFEEVLQT